MAGPCCRLLLAVVLALLGCLMQGSSRHGGPPHWQVAAAAHPSGRLNLTELREEAREMFRFGFGQYMARAFPRDDLRPISCRGKDSQGGIALTLLDSLDTLAVMGEGEELRRAVAWLAANATFDVDARVHVFELTIRADPSLAPGYDGCLLRLAVDLADRFMPAFDTPTGVPLSWGQIPGDVRSTCVACAGTLLLEFGVLSRLTGNATYEDKARHAVETIYSMRSARGLVGNTLNCDTGAWERTDAGVGAGVDSFYEYLLKAYLAFGDGRYLDMFARLYAAAMTNLQLDPNWNGNIWLVDVDMHQGNVLHPYVWSLGAFWPGLQALAGQVAEGRALHLNWTSAWHKFGWLPEMFDVGMEGRHPTETGYPLRPELMESTFLLHAASGDPSLLGVGASLQRRLRERNRVACGYASVGDVSTGHLEDTMESFFLSETAKYLFLLFANASSLVDHYVLSTEGHLLPPFPDAPEQALSCAAPEPVTSNGTCASDGAAAGQEGSSKQQQPEQQAKQQQQQRKQPSEEQEGMCPWSEAPSSLQPKQGPGAAATSEQQRRLQQMEAAIDKQVADKCSHLCSSQSRGEAAAGAAALRAAMPLVPLPPGAPALLRTRRCIACQRVTRALRHEEISKKLLASAAGQVLEQAVMSRIRLSNKPAVAASGLRVNRQFICVVEESSRGSLVCAVLRELAPNQISQQRLDELPQNYLFIQLTDVPLPAGSEGEQCSSDELAADQMPSERVSVLAMMPGGAARKLEGQLAEFGPAFMPGCGKLGDPGGSSGGSTSSGGGGGGGGGDRSSGGGEGAAAGAAASTQQQQQRRQQPREQQRQQRQSPQLEQFMGRPLEVQMGGTVQRPWRVVRLGLPIASLGGGSGTAAQQPPKQQGQRWGQQGGDEDDDDPYLDPSDGEEEEQAAEAAAEEEEEEDEVYSDGLDDADDGASAPLALCSVEAPAVAAQPLDACGRLDNAAALNGSVAVVQRGSCMFVEKALAAQAAGALGLLVVNTGDELMGMGSDAQGTQSEIPAVLVSQADGAGLLHELMSPSSVTDGGGSTLRLHLSAAPAPATGEGAPGAAGGKCSSGGAGGAGGSAASAGVGTAAEEAMQAAAREAAKAGKRLQQVELLMSARAQQWLFHRLAAANRDPATVLKQVLAQLQAHFARQEAAAEGAADEEL